MTFAREGNRKNRQWGTPYRTHLPTRESVHTIRTVYTYIHRVDPSLRLRRRLLLVVFTRFNVYGPRTNGTKNGAAFPYIFPAKNASCRICFARFRTRNRRPGTLRNVSLCTIQTEGGGGSVRGPGKRSDRFPKIV